MTTITITRMLPRRSGPRARSARRGRPTSTTPPPSEDGEAEVKAAPVADDPFAGTGRNEKCPCGSGKKYKQCHGAPGGASGHATVGG
ncbi:SEC-C metal-binding domain-containing protein [Nocardioides sp. B-3]|uniref:SEC-C metal-binding domain-containing protein n=1 Tax=Nocardioides sp. B-3 TaxID=2895565 RepID=UPI002152C467|nr:SEC-C metal-binding domain-containing protein [Nocardioides sp. B-3]UUZ58127.1 SEC-C domain-containing protein [Nocardioides sp. B-3]